MREHRIPIPVFLENKDLSRLHAAIDGADASVSLPTIRAITLYADRRVPRAEKRQERDYRKMAALPNGREVQASSKHLATHGPLKEYVPRNYPQENLDRLLGFNCVGPA